MGVYKCARREARSDRPQALGLGTILRPVAAGLHLRVKADGDGATELRRNLKHRQQQQKQQLAGPPAFAP
jgi:hypothetical protein